MKNYLWVVILIFVIGTSCNSPTTTRVDTLPENGVVMTGTEGTTFTGSITYEYSDGSSAIADLATLEVPESVDFDSDVRVAKVEITKLTETGTLILNLVERGDIIRKVETNEKGKLLSVTFDNRTSHDNN